jgi:hypothetical protein
VIRTLQTLTTVLNCVALTIGVLTTAAPIASAQTTVFFSDFETPAAPNLIGAGSRTSTQGYSTLGFGRTFWRNASVGNISVFSVENLPAHTALRITFDLAIIDSWDGSTQLGGGHPEDFFNVLVDRATKFKETFDNLCANDQSAHPPTATTISFGVQRGFTESRPGTLNPCDGKSAINQTINYYDSAYHIDLGLVPHTASSVIIEFFANGNGWLGGDDESWAIDNISVVATEAEPATRAVSFFPAVLDGQVSGASYYTSSLVVYARSATSCDFSLGGMPVPEVTLTDGSTRTESPIQTTLNEHGWVVLTTSGAGNLTVGYGELSCDDLVDALILYTFYDAGGNKLSEVTASAQGPAYQAAQVILDQRRGERLAIVITNAEEAAVTLRLTLTNTAGSVVGEAVLVVNAGSVFSKFVDEVISNLPAHFVGKLDIRADDAGGLGKFHGMAFSFASASPAFTAIPVVPCLSTSNVVLPDCREVRPKNNKP